MAIRLDTVTDINTKQRKVANFHNLHIPDIVRLGKVNTNCFPSNIWHLEIHPDCFELVFVLDGHGTLTTSSEDFHVVGGEMLLTYPNEEHAYRLEKSHIYYLIFRCMPEDTFLSFHPQASKAISAMLHTCTRRIVPYSKELIRLLERILTEYFKDCVFKREVITSLFTLFFYELQRMLSTPTEEIMNDRDMNPIVHFLSENFSHAGCLYDISKKFHISQSHFIRKFKQTTGFTPHDFVLRKKIEAAKELLGAHQTVCSVSDLMGFSSASYFTKVFRKYTGCAPGQYSKK